MMLAGSGSPAARALALDPDRDSSDDPPLDFEVRSRPVLGRLLVSYACMMHTLMSVYGSHAENVSLERFVTELADSGDKDVNLRWGNESEPDIFKIVHPYVLKRFGQAMSGEYARF